MAAANPSRRPLTIAAIAALGVAVVGGAAFAGGLVGGHPSASPTLAVASGTPGPSASPSSSGDGSTPTPTSSPSPTASPTASPSPTPTTVPDALTGRLVDPAVAKRHPIAVMLDDLGPARPQSGLSLASIVWHAPAEGGIPRYMAIFQENLPKVLGPVRSSRYYYIAWAAEWRAVYAHAGGSPQAIDTLKAKGGGQWVYNIDEFRHGGSFYRITTRFAPHNLYTKGSTLRKVGAQAGAKDKALKAAWQFAADAPLDARPYGGTITVSYPWNTITYHYDRKTNTYLRSVTGEKKEIDAATGLRIAPQNVIVMRMSFGPLNDGHPNKHRLEAKVVGSGTAWISTNGRTIKGTWKKTSITSPTLFYDKDGNPVTLTVGQTFIQVMPIGAPVSFKAGSDTPPATPSPSPSPS